MIKEKRGQGLSTNAIILIILGVIILAVLIVGFSAGWNKILPWISSNNVDSIVEGCQISCSSGKVYDFCSKQRILISDDLPNNIKEVEGNCTFFATAPGYEKYAVQDCPALC